MSAKSTLAKNNVENFNEELPSFEGQDIFVENDPALLRKATTTTEPNRQTKDTHQDLRMEKLNYIHEILLELRKLSNTLEQPMVTYLLEMALLETDTAINVAQFDSEVGK